MVLHSLSHLIALVLYSNIHPAFEGLIQSILYRFFFLLTCQYHTNLLIFFAKSMFGMGRDELEVIRGGGFSESGAGEKE